MKKIAVTVLGILALAVLGVLGAATLQPDHIHVERSMVLAARPADLAPFVEDLELVNEWSPWNDRDPNIQRDYSESTTGVGAEYHWTGNQEVGEGTMAITAVAPGQVTYHLRFVAPFEGVAETSVTYVLEDGGSRVTWAFDEDANFTLKVMTLFMSMDAMIGADYEAGLNKLKPLAEAVATAREAADLEAAKKAAEEAAQATQGEAG